ncbi:YgiT-type zinc finger protein [bacterium]|nr:YgiT-type zinc finger protein [bacterium]
MKCTHCQGKMERGTAPFHIDRKGYHLLLDAVPAWVCSQCGEAYFKESEVDAIQAVIQSVDKQTEKLTTTV